MRRILATATLLVIACKSLPPDELSSRDVVEIGPKTGGVGAKLLEDSAAPQVQLGPDEEFVAASLASQNDPPEYPPHLLAASLPSHVVAIRVMFDENGRVMSISESPLASSTHSEYASHFRAAVTEVVRVWRCSPARIRKFREGPDGDGAFEIVNGQPIVKRWE